MKEKEKELEICIGLWLGLRWRGRTEGSDVGFWIVGVD